MGGGWAMFVLVPASIVALATILRVGILLWGKSVRKLAAEVQTTVVAQKRHGPMSMTDARIIAMDQALNVYVALQPLALIYTVAPIIGALGTTWALGKVWRGPVSLQARYLASALEHAFMPLGWGLCVALLAITGYALLKARLATVERYILTPAAISALNEPLERKFGERKI